jgi:predicted amidophosphoribosyltransferase
VVFDDIRTTGATIDAIAKNLREADADEVWALYLMRQKF